MTMEVNPDRLLFTQDSIRNRFKAPREEERIDDAVDCILQGTVKASDFPRLNVVAFDGQLWSLDNRRLWVFKKAKVPTITVNIVSYYANPRFRELVEQNPTLKTAVLQQGYSPHVRGDCRTVFEPPVPLKSAIPQCEEPESWPKLGSNVSKVPERVFKSKSYVDAVGGNFHQVLKKSEPAQFKKPHCGPRDGITNPERHKQIPTVATDAYAWRKDLHRDPVNDPRYAWKRTRDILVDINLPLQKAPDQSVVRGGESHSQMVPPTPSPSNRECQGGEPIRSEKRNVWSWLSTWLKILFLDE